jgi:uncharacterized membrane protein YhaH (DUF805 family)
MSATFMLQLVDPRGRCDRKGFLLAAATLLVLQAAVAAAMWSSGAAFHGWQALAAGAAFAWLGYAAISKRLHDLGRSAWWIPAAVLLWLVGAFVFAVGIAVAANPDVLAPGTPAYWVTFLLMMLPLAGIALWLHAAAGDSDANRFGAAPSVLGFSVPDRA